MARAVAEKGREGEAEVARALRWPRSARPGLLKEHRAGSRCLLAARTARGRTREGGAGGVGGVHEGGRPREGGAHPWPRGKGRGAHAPMPMRSSVGLHAPQLLFPVPVPAVEPLRQGDERSVHGGRRGAGLEELKPSVVPAEVHALIRGDRTRPI